MSENLIIISLLIFYHCQNRISLSLLPTVVFLKHLPLNRQIYLYPYHILVTLSSSKMIHRFTEKQQTKTSD